MEQSVEKIIERNLLEVFNRRDAGSRRAAWPAARPHGPASGLVPCRSVMRTASSS
jgi:hypothetical protein